MECDICERLADTTFGFFCVSCARNAVYLPRLEHAQLLLEKQSLGHEVEETVARKDGDSLVADNGSELTPDQSVWQIEMKHIQTNETKRSIERTRQSQEETKKELAELKNHIHLLKSKIAEKKITLKKVQSTLPQRRELIISGISSVNKKAIASLEKIQQRSQEDRAKLCREAASLMRLRQRRRQRDSTARDQYSIAGLTLPDLREISNLRCADLNAVLGSVAHLTMIVAFYLGIRLPAEITEPHPDYPLHTITAPAGSYQGYRPDFQVFASSSSTPTSPSDSRHEKGTILKPRPLYIGTAVTRDERVSNFQTKDEYAFKLFVEGMALLAWNVAWLCRSQGYSAGTNSWEEICNIGRNLHHLLIANPQAPSITRIKSEKGIQMRPDQTRKMSSPLLGGRKEVAGKLGQYTDSSAGSTAKAPQRDLLTSWEYSASHKVAIPLRKTLLTEIASAEWELLLDDEWDDGGEQFNEAVFVKTRALDGQQYDDARSIMTTRPETDEATLPARIPGTSGWTKLKNRDKAA